VRILAAVMIAAKTMARPIFSPLEVVGITKAPFGGSLNKICILVHIIK
jgi:hypothetical protein